MASALLCFYFSIEEDLEGTLLWRDDVERRFAGSAEEAYAMAQVDKPDLVVVDRDLPAATRLVKDLRRNPSTRQTSIVIVARTDFEPIEMAILEAGANAVFRYPAGSEWDERLACLLNVPARRDVRLPVNFEMEARTGAGILSLSGTAYNLSVHGILLETSYDLHVGDDIDLSFRLPDDQHGIVGCGHVVRQESPKLFGIEFYGLEADGTARVRDYVKRRLASAEVFRT